MGQERAAEQATQEGLEADPFHKAIKIFIPGVEADGHGILPVSLCLSQRFFYLFFRMIFPADFVNAGFLLLHAEQDSVGCLFTWKKGKVSETERTHGFTPFRGGRRRHAGTFFIDGTGVGEGSALADILFHGGEESLGSMPFAGKTADIIGFMIAAMPLFIKGQYSERKMLSHSYMIEVLAGELLLQGYAAYNCYIQKNTDWHVAKYHFLGSEENFPLEMLPELLKTLTPLITCNSSFCMLPKKSVAFIAELTRDDKVRCRGICVDCSNLNCSGRMAEGSLAWKRVPVMTDMPLTYGYGRIFGLF